MINEGKPERAIPYTRPNATAERRELVAPEPVNAPAGLLQEATPLFLLRRQWPNPVQKALHQRDPDGENYDDAGDAKYKDDHGSLPRGAEC